MAPPLICAVLLLIAGLMAVALSDPWRMSTTGLPASLAHARDDQRHPRPGRSVPGMLGEGGFVATTHSSAPRISQNPPPSRAA